MSNDATTHDIMEPNNYFALLPHLTIQGVHSGIYTDVNRKILTKFQ